MRRIAEGTFESERELRKRLSAVKWEMIRKADAEAVTSEEGYGGLTGRCYGYGDERC